MPLEKPSATFGGRTWWIVLAHGEHFLLQSHRVPAIWFGHPFRILVEGNSYQIASAPTKEGAFSDWNELRQMCMTDAKLKAILSRSASKEDIAKDLIEYFEAYSRQLTLSASPQTPLITSFAPPRPTTPPPPPPFDIPPAVLARAQLHDSSTSPLYASDGVPASNSMPPLDGTAERKVSESSALLRKQSARDYYRERTLELSRAQDYTLVIEAYNRRALQIFDANTRVDTSLFAVSVSPLFLAIELSLLDSAKELLLLGANANERLMLSGLKGAQASLLHLAAYAFTGYDAARLLLAHGADPNMRDNFGCSPLHVACLRGHKNLVLLLQSTGADSRARDLLNEEPIDKAVRGGHAEIQELLRQQGATARLVPTNPLPAPVALRLLLVGASGSGKTTFMRRLTTNVIDEKERPSVGVTSGTKTMTADGLPYDLVLLDAAGLARYRSVVPLYYANSHLALVFYDCTRRESYSYAKHLVTELATSLSPHAIIGLLATKLDKPSVVPREEASAWAAERRLVFAETSSFTEGLAQPVLNVREVLVLLLQEYGRVMGRFPAPPAAAVAERAVQCPPCRVVDFQYGRRMDYRHSLSARLLAGNPFHKGWLTKKGHWVQSWRRRYCILKDHFLYYFLTEGDETPRGFIPIYSCSIKETSERPFAFEISTASTPLSRAHPSFTMAADSQTEKEEWIEAIEAAKLFAEQLRSRMPEARKWLTALRPTFNDTFYVNVDFRPSVEAQTLVLTSLGLPTSESVTLRIRLDSALHLYKSPTSRELLLTNNVDLRLLLLDSSPDAALLSFLQRSVPPDVVFGSISPADYLLNCQLSYLLTVERLPYPLLKPIADQLGNWSALLATGDKDAEALRVCDLNGAELTAPDMDGLTQALAFYPLCTRLELREATIDDYGFAILMEELCERKESLALDLQGVNFTSAQLIALTQMLRKNRYLQSLSLARCPLKDTSVEQVMNALAANHTITSLNLSCISFNSELAFSSLCRLLELSTPLVAITLHQCDLNEALCTKLLPSLSKNTVLELCDCGLPASTQLFNKILTRNHLEKEREKREKEKQAARSVARSSIIRGAQL